MSGKPIYSVDAIAHQQSVSWKQTESANTAEQIMNSLSLLVAMLIAYMLSIGFGVGAVLNTLISVIKVILIHRVVMLGIKQQHILRSTSINNRRETD